MAMLSSALKQEFYQALLSKDQAYDGIFFVGVKTTEVFCRASCPARKPKFEHCDFYRTTKEALFAGYRPCLRCRPLDMPKQLSETIHLLLQAIDANPEKRWKNADLAVHSIDASTARRQFKKRFGMTFVEYARARRMGLAIKEIRAGKAVLATQLSLGYESSSGFRDAFTKIMGGSPQKVGQAKCLLSAAWLDTPLGPMLAIADEAGLYLLEFVDRRGLEREIERLRLRKEAAILPGITAPIGKITEELLAYFSGSLRQFTTAYHLLGSPFQQTVWQELSRIPYGKTLSYAEEALALGRPQAVRAVANANGANQLSIIIPCHRVIASNGELGGYGGGLHRKKWLLAHEKQF